MKSYNGYQELSLGIYFKNWVKILYWKDPRTNQNNFSCLQYLQNILFWAICVLTFSTCCHLTYILSASHIPSCYLEKNGIYNEEEGDGGGGRNRGGGGGGEEKGEGGEDEEKNEEREDKEFLIDLDSLVYTIIFALKNPVWSNLSSNI